MEARLEDQMERCGIRSSSEAGRFWTSMPSRDISQKDVEIASLYDRARKQCAEINQIEMDQCRRREIEDLASESSATGGSGRPPDDKNSENIRLLGKELIQFEKDLQGAQKELGAIEEVAHEAWWDLGGRPL